MPLETIKAGQMEEQQTEEHRYEAEMTQLEAAVQQAETAMDETERAVRTQAQICAITAVIDNAGGYRGMSPTPPSESREQRWRETPKQDHQALTRLLDTRVQQLGTLERARLALTHRRAQWQHARAREAFLSTPKGQVLKRELEEIMAAYEVAKAANQGDMVRVLGIKADNVNQRIATGMMGL